MVRCELCRRAELKPLERLQENILSLILGTSPSAIEIYRHSMETFTRAVLGNTPVTDYERHRAAYIETGDVQELARMLRHVA